MRSYGAAALIVSATLVISRDSCSDSDDNVFLRSRGRGRLSDDSRLPDDNGCGDRDTNSPGIIPATTSANLHP